MGLGFGAGQRMVSAVGSGQRALKGPGIPLSGSSLQISRLRRSLSRPPLSFLSISLYLCLRARLGGVRLGPGGLGVGRSIVSGHQLSLAPRPGLGADRRRRLVSEETFGFGGDVWFWRRRLGSVARHGCFVQFHDWFLVSLAALICYHRRKELVSRESERMKLLATRQDEPERGRTDYGGYAVGACSQLLCGAVTICDRSFALVESYRPP
jgi:hypothetical protein